MKILFLDIDGVLNTDNFRDTYGSETLNSYLVHNLIRVVNVTGCKIVISSDWRFGSITAIHNALKCPGFCDSPTEQEHQTLISSIVGVTLDFGSRESEIKEWVKHNCIKQWVAVDDLELDLPFEHFVHTDPTVGLSEQCAIELIKRLS